VNRGSTKIPPYAIRPPPARLLFSCSPYCFGLPSSFAAFTTIQIEKRSIATSDSPWSCPAEHRCGRACLFRFRESLVTVVAVSLSGHFLQCYFESPFRYLIVSRMLAAKGNKKPQRCNPQSEKSEPAGFGAGNARAITK
jgi:hypothetical protein